MLLAEAYVLKTIYEKASGHFRLSLGGGVNNNIVWIIYLFVSEFIKF